MAAENFAGRRASSVCAGFCVGGELVVKYPKQKLHLRTVKRLRPHATELLAKRRGFAATQRPARGHAFFL
jgi:hypothetical protein